MYKLLNLITFMYIVYPHNDKKTVCNSMQSDSKSYESQVHFQMHYKKWLVLPSIDQWQTRASAHW